MKEQKKISEDEKINVIISLFIAEYNVLRSEIDIYHQHQKDIINFVFIVLTAMFGVLGASFAFQKINLYYLPHIFLLFPFIYTLLACLYTDQTIRIIRIADYLHNHLRKNVNKIVDANVWQWEIYKKNTSIFNRKLTLILDRVRWLIFIVPCFLSILISMCLMSEDEIKQSVLSNQTTSSLFFILLLLDALSILVLFLLIFVTEETSGVKSKESIDLDEKS